MIGICWRLLVLTALGLSTSPAVAEFTQNKLAPTHSAQQLIAACIDGSGPCDGEWRGVEVLFKKSQVEIYPLTSSGKSAASWMIECRVDPIDDERSCNMSSNAIMFFRDNRTPGIKATVVSGTNYPGTTEVLRVDANAPITVAEDELFSSATTAKIMNQMAAGSRLVSRYRGWPYNNAIDTGLDLRGFAEVREIYDAVASAHYRGLTFPDPKPARVIGPVLWDKIAYGMRRQEFVAAVPDIAWPAGAKSLRIDDKLFSAIVVLKYDDTVQAVQLKFAASTSPRALYQELTGQFGPAKGGSCDYPYTYCRGEWLKDGVSVTLENWRKDRAPTVLYRTDRDGSFVPPWQD